MVDEGLAELVMQPSTQEMYSKITGSIPARTDVDLSVQGFTDGQRSSAQNLRDAVGQDRVVLSLGHNMAQPSYGLPRGNLKSNLIGMKRLVGRADS